MPIVITQNKNMQPVVSIIVPNYNHAQFIADAINSVRAQSLQQWECIIIDDASTDNSVEIVKDLIKSDKRFKLITNKKHIGVSCARNLGLDQARGEYIAFLDSDDCYTQNALETLIWLAKTNNADVVGGRTQIVMHDFSYTPTNTNPHTIGKWHSESTNGILVFPNKEYNWCWIWRRIYHRNTIAGVRFLPELTHIGEDLCFMLTLCHNIKHIIESDCVTVYHRWHSKSMMHTQFKIDHFDFFPIIFQYMQNNILDKYDFNTLKLFYEMLFEYLIDETILRPKRTGKFHNAARRTLIQSCKLIPRRYLSPKKRILCWFFACMK